MTVCTYQWNIILYDGYQWLPCCFIQWSIVCHLTWFLTQLYAQLFLTWFPLLGNAFFTWSQGLGPFFILLHTLFFISSLCWIMVVSYSQSFNPDWVIKPSDLLCSLYKVIICSLIASVSRFYIQLPHLRLSNIFPQPRTVLISRLRSLFNSSTYICNIRHKN